MISRQREWQIRRRRLGLCTKCGKPAAPSLRKGAFGTSTYCMDHLIRFREYQRNQKGHKKRHTEAVSYLLEEIHDNKQ